MSDFIEAKQPIDGMDECIIGIWNRTDGEPIIAYATTPMIDKLSARMGTARHYAEKYFWSEFAPKFCK